VRKIGYNLANDLAEKNNLASEHPSKVAELKAKLQAWQQQTGADIPTELNPEYDPVINQKLITDVFSKKE
jgi:hypothetical protein